MAGHGSAPGHMQVCNTVNPTTPCLLPFPSAGLLAEQKFLGQQWRFEEDVVKHLRAVRAGEDEGLCLYPSDLRAVALALLDDDPPISLAGARRAVVYCQEYTEALLDDPRVWAGAERLAKVLSRRGYLSPRAVKKVLGDAFFADVRMGARVE